MVLWPVRQGRDALSNLAKVDRHSENGTLDGRQARHSLERVLPLKSLEHQEFHESIRPVGPLDRPELPFDGSVCPLDEPQTAAEPALVRLHHFRRRMGIWLD